MKSMCRLVFWVGVLCLRIAVAQADTIPCYDSLKLQLHEQSLPLINLVVDIDHVSKPTYTPAFVEICDPMKRMGGDGVTLLACKVKYRGNTSIRYDKKSFTIQVVDGQGEELNVNLFGLRRDKTWVLDAMAVDRIRMRNRVNFDVWNAMSRVPYDTELDRRNGTVGLFVELFINGEYHGLYCFTDKVNRKLLDLKKPRVDDKGQPIIRGVLYKGREWSSATRLRGYETDTTWQKKWNGWELAYPEDYPCEEAYLPLVRFIDYCAKSSNEQLQTDIPKWFYMDNLRDYMVFLLSQGILDNLFKNAYLSVVDKSKGNRMLITPWDLDCSLGGSWDGSYYTNPIWEGFILSAELPRRLWEGNVAGFKGLVYDRWQALRQTVLSEEAFCGRLDAYARMFEESGAWERECAKWNGNPVPLKRNISEELDYVKDWYHRNSQSYFPWRGIGSKGDEG